MPQNRQQELKPALPEWQQFLFNFKNNPLTALNPEIVNDPVYQKTEELGEVLYPMLDPNDPFNQIQAAAAKNPAVAGILAAARLAKRTKKVKAPAPTTQAAPAIIKKDPGEQLAKQLNRETLAHGSTTRGIKDLRRGLIGQSTKSGRYRPQDLQATGGTYLTRGIMDPRLLDYIGKRGSVYLVNPRFQRTLNTGRVPSQVRKLVDKEIAATNAPREAYETLGDYVKGGGNFYSKQLARTVNPRVNPNPRMQHISPPYPTRLQGEVADFFRNQGYDSLRYKPTPAFKDTIIALDPENTLDIIEEIPYEELLRKLIELSQ